MPLYLDSSAIVKLVLREDESDALTEYLGSTFSMTSDLALVEVPRALRRASAGDSTIVLEDLLTEADALLSDMAIVMSVQDLLTAAGGLESPSLRAIDAVHIATALELEPEVFVTYDARQAAAARLSGLRTAAPGA